VYWTRCHFRYTVDGAQHESTATTTSTRSQAMVRRMTNWINAHHKGTTLTIHYDPPHPDNISLAGADEEIQTHTATVKLHAAEVLGISGLAFLLVAVFLRRLKSSPELSIDGAMPSRSAQ